MSTELRELCSGRVLVPVILLILFFTVMVASVYIHEFTHYTIAQEFGWSVSEFVVTYGGGWVALSEDPMELPLHQLVVFACTPVIVNFLILLFADVFLSRVERHFSGLIALIVDALEKYLELCNAILVIINAFPFPYLLSYGAVPVNDYSLALGLCLVKGNLPLAAAVVALGIAMCSIVALYLYRRVVD